MPIRWLNRDLKNDRSYNKYVHRNENTEISNLSSWLDSFIQFSFSSGHFGQEIRADGERQNGGIESKEGHQWCNLRTGEGAVEGTLNKSLEKEDPVYRNPIEVLWELSQDTIYAF